MESRARFKLHTTSRDVTGTPSCHVARGSRSNARVTESRRFQDRASIGSKLFSSAVTSFRPGRARGRNIRLATSTLALAELKVGTGSVGSAPIVITIVP